MHDHSECFRTEDTELLYLRRVYVSGGRGNGRRKADSKQFICWFLSFPSRGVNCPPNPPHPGCATQLLWTVSGEEHTLHLNLEEIRGARAFLGLVRWSLRPLSGRGSLHSGHNRDLPEPNPHPGRLRRPAVLGNEEMRQKQRQLRLVQVY